MSYFIFFFVVLETQYIYYTYSIPCLGQAAFQALHSYMYQSMAFVLYSTHIEGFHDH